MRHIPFKLWTIVLATTVVITVILGPYRIASKECAICGRRLQIRSSLGITYSAKASTTAISEWLEINKYEPCNHLWVGHASESRATFAGRLVFACGPSPLEKIYRIKDVIDVESRGRIVRAYQNLVRHDQPLQAVLLLDYFVMDSRGMDVDQLGVDLSAEIDNALSATPTTWPH